MNLQVSRYKARPTRTSANQRLPVDAKKPAQLKPIDGAGAKRLPTTDEAGVRSGTQACLPLAAYPQPRWAAIMHSNTNSAGRNEKWD